MHYLDTLSIGKKRQLQQGGGTPAYGLSSPQNRPNAQKYHSEANLTDALPRRLDICPAQQVLIGTYADRCRKSCKPLSPCNNPGLLYLSIPVSLTEY